MLPSFRGAKNTARRTQACYAISTPLQQQYEGPLACDPTTLDFLDSLVTDSRAVINDLRIDGRNAPVRTRTRCASGSSKLNRELEKEAAQNRHK